MYITARPQQQKAPAPNVFDFINTTLGRGAQPAGGSVAEPLLLRKDSKSQKGPVDEKDARKKLFMMQVGLRVYTTQDTLTYGCLAFRHSRFRQEQLRQVEKRLTAETESLNRNTGRDKLMGMTFAKHSHTSPACFVDRPRFSCVQPIMHNPRSTIRNESFRR